jgi:hypothetical protein
VSEQPTLNVAYLAESFFRIISHQQNYQEQVTAERNSYAGYQSLAWDL